MSTQTPSSWGERLSSPLTWHWLGVAVLSMLVIVLGVRLGLDWAATNGNSADALIGKQIELKTLQVQTAPLRGLDQRVADSRKQMLDFYDKRIPANYSSIAESIGSLQVKSGVRLSRVQYTPGVPGIDLTEIAMDATISGEYTQIMHFINGLERDKTFFVIRSAGLTGQQGGLVNLRLQVSTWMRPSDVPAVPLQTPAGAPAGAPPVKEGE